MSKDARIFRQWEVELGEGWIVDLSPEHCVNPDCYYRFRKLAQAKKFLSLVDSGDHPWNANSRIYQDIMEGVS